MLRKSLVIVSLLFLLGACQQPAPKETVKIEEAKSTVEDTTVYIDGINPITGKKQPPNDEKIKRWGIRLAEAYCKCIVKEAKEICLQRVHARIDGLRMEYPDDKVDLYEKIYKENKTCE